MSAKNGFEDNLMKLIFNNDALANIGNVAGLQPSAAAGSLFVALYTAAPTESAKGTECVYTNYERVAVARTSGGWTISGDTPTKASNAAVITFPQCGATGETITHFAICESGTEDADDQIFYGALDSSLIVSSGITPEIAIGSLDVNVD